MDILNPDRQQHHSKLLSKGLFANDLECKLIESLNILIGIVHHGKRVIKTKSTWVYLTVVIIIGITQSSKFFSLCLTLLL